MEEPGKDLLAAVEQLDEAGCAALLRLAEPTIVAALNSRAFKEPEDQEDVAQETRCAIVESIETFKPAKGKFRSWVWGITSNCYNSYWRRWKKNQEDPFRDLGDGFDPAAIAPTDNSKPTKLVKALREVYDSFSAEHRAVVDHMLAHADGFGRHDDLANVLRISPDAAKQLVYRTKKRLKDEITQRLSTEALPENQFDTPIDSKKEPIR